MNYGVIWVLFVCSADIQLKVVAEADWTQHVLAIAPLSKNIYATKLLVLQVT